MSHKQKLLGQTLTRGLLLAALSGCAAEGNDDEGSVELGSEPEGEDIGTSTQALPARSWGPTWISVLGPALQPITPKVLDIRNWSLDNFGPAHLWDLRNTGEVRNQRWYLDYTGIPNVYMIRNQLSGKCLDKSQSYGTGNGVPVYQYDCHGRLNQQWEFVAAPDGFPNWGTLVNGEDGRCLDVQGVSFTNGARLQVWDCHGAWNQRWNIL